MSDHSAPSLVGVAAGSENVPAPVKMSAVSAPSVTVPQCTVAPSSCLADNCR
jgi:hypothetical protein